MSRQLQNQSEPPFVFLDQPEQEVTYVSSFRNPYRLQNREWGNTNPAAAYCHQQMEPTQYYPFHDQPAHPNHLHDVNPPERFKAPRSTYRSYKDLDAPSKSGVVKSSWSLVPTQFSERVRGEAGIQPQNGNWDHHQGRKQDDLPRQQMPSVETKSQDDKNRDLRTAASKGQLEVVKQLLKTGADINAKNPSNMMTPLILASNHNNLEVTKELLAKGADVDLTSFDGITALMLAVKLGSAPSILKELLKNGANIEAACQSSGWTSIMLAAKFGHLTALKDLIEAGADYQKGDNDGNTSLMLASKYGKYDIVQELLAAGADHLRANKYGKQALDLAMNKRMATLIQDFQNRSEGENESKGNEEIQEVIPSQESLLTERNCVVCLKPRRVKSYLMDCGHISTCFQCAQDIFYQSVKKECPTCKNPIQEVRKAFD